MTKTTLTLDAFLASRREVPVADFCDYHARIFQALPEEMESYGAVQAWRYLEPDSMYFVIRTAHGFECDWTQGSRACGTLSEAETNLFVDWVSQRD